MSDRASADAANHLLRVAREHPECAGGKVLADLRIRLDMKVEMPLHLKADGVSTTGVRTIEPVTFVLPPGYPWRSPSVTLRPDFPRSFPHLQPGSATTLPRPCLVDGSQDEFFLQWGLVEYGIFHLIEQVAIWLRKAAIDALIDSAQGWEPMLRRDLADVIALDADSARLAVTKSGGFATWDARYYRRGERDARVTVAASAFITSEGKAVPLRHKSDDDQFTASRDKTDVTIGRTVVGIVWPDKLPSGKPHVSDRYWPEDIASLGDLRDRALQFGCERGFEQLLSNIERSFAGLVLRAPIPIGILLCVRRPVHLINSASPIELLPYVVEIRPEPRRGSLFAQGDKEPVAPAMHYQLLTAALLRTLSAAPARPAIAMLGCGSVGSKLALHAARGGQEVVAVSDQGSLRPHNMARHALGGRHIATDKAEALAEELRDLKQQPAVYNGDIAAALRFPASRRDILPAASEAVVNATASLSVREALVGSTQERDRPRLFEAALFGKGRVAYLLVDGKGHNPNHSDLMAELYATIDDSETAALLFDPDEGLAQIQIGQGCGSLTMAVDDAQLSMMAAALSKEIGRALDHPVKEGAIVIGVSEENSPATRWSKQAVPSFETVLIDGSDGWQLRISQRVAKRIRQDAKLYGNVETGGIMIGLSSARLKTVTVVDLLDAPPDSTRSASLFLLGTQGLQAQINDRHEVSGRTLFDVGTWHSHLAEQGPSPTDWRTAADLAAGRAPPSVLLIATPTRFHALIAKKGESR